MLTLEYESFGGELNPGNTEFLIINASLIEIVSPSPALDLIMLMKFIFVMMHIRFYSPQSPFVPGIYDHIS